MFATEVRSTRATFAPVCSLHDVVHHAHERQDALEELRLGLGEVREEQVLGLANVACARSKVGDDDSVHVLVGGLELQRLERSAREHVNLLDASTEKPTARARTNASIGKRKPPKPSSLAFASSSLPNLFIGSMFSTSKIDTNATVMGRPAQVGEDVAAAERIQFDHALVGRDALQRSECRGRVEKRGGYRERAR